MTTEKYTVQYGQNIFDVCLAIYGSIEGLLDLMVCNPELSVDTELNYGDILLYSPYYTEDDSVLSTYKEENTIPANGTSHIYFKPTKSIVMFFVFPAEEYLASMKLSGSGEITIDWGDDSDLEPVVLTSEVTEIVHAYPQNDSKAHIARFYGSDVTLYSLNANGLKMDAMHVINKVRIDNLFLSECGKLNLSFLKLVNRTLNLDFSGSKVSGLEGLISCKTAYNISLADCGLSTEEIDAYLIGLVKNYDERLACTVNLIGNDKPSGTYQEPEDLLNPQSGLEAIYVIVNYHKEYNGTWAFIIDDNNIYQ